MKQNIVFTIRKAGKNDFEDLLRLNKALFDFEDQFNKTYNLAWTYSEVGRNYFKERIDDKNASVFVSVVDKKVVGYILGYVQAYRYSSVNPICDIENMFIEEPFRNSGIGKSLMDHVKKEAKKMGVKKMSLWAFIDNKNAIAYYYAMGFSDERLHLELLF